MKIKAINDFKHHPLYLTKGDIVTVNDELGATVVGLGFAMNLGTGEINEPSSGPVSLDINSTAHGVTNTEV